MKRLVKLYCKDYILSTIDSVIESTANISNYYIEVVEFFNKFNEDFYHAHVKGIFIDALPGDSLPIHFDFCREVAQHYKTFVYFEANGLSFKISENTPGDWYDICIDDCYRKHKDGMVFGPDYVKLNVDDAKHGICVCKKMIELRQDMILDTVYPEMSSFGISWQLSFKSYEDYKKWAVHLYEGIFILQRRMKRYLDILKENGSQLTEDDLLKYDKLLNDNLNDYLKDL